MDMRGDSLHAHSPSASGARFPSESERASIRARDQRRVDLELSSPPTPGKHLKIHETRPFGSALLEAYLTDR